MARKIYHQAHDKLYKRSMSDINVAKEIIQGQLPPILLESIDFSSLKKEPTEFIDEKFKLKQADLIYSANFTEQVDNKAYFYFLCEHQSKNKYLMAFTLLIYIIEIMKDHMEKYPDGPLPIVYPIVLYANQTPWTAPTDIFKLFGKTETIARELMFKPFTLIDVNRTADEDLKSKKLSGLFLYALKYRQSKEIAKYFDTLLPWLNEVAQENRATCLVENVIFYMLEGLETEDTELLLEKAEHYLSAELRGEVMTLAHAFTKQGIQQGLQQGLQQGEHKKECEIALKMLSEGFPVAAIAKITGLSREVIDKLSNKEN